MDEPDWDELRWSLKCMTMRRIRPIRKLFGGTLSGATSKGETVQRMIAQLRYWWTERRDLAEQIVAAIEEAAK